MKTYKKSNGFDTVLPFLSVKIGSVRGSSGVECEALTALFRVASVVQMADDNSDSV